MQKCVPQEYALAGRYAFKPEDYSNYFFLIGFMYAASQIFSRAVINRFDANPTPLLTTCLLVIGTVRYPAWRSGQLICHLWRDLDEGA
jgi:hypothetical protein